MIKTFEQYNNKQITLQEAIKLSQLSDIKSVGEWLNKDINDIKFYYKEEPFEMFESTALEMESTYDEFKDEEKRTYKILKLLNSGKPPMPIFVAKNDNDKFIMEGRHRIVAFLWFDLKTIPVIYVE